MDELIDTHKLQLQSLIEFASGLGYEYSRHPVKKYFYSRLPENKDKEILSFNTMVQMHNNNYDLWALAFDKHKLIKATFSKITERCKLQYCKKAKVIKCQNNQVQFVDWEYEELFLK